MDRSKSYSLRQAEEAADRNRLHQELPERTLKNTGDTESHIRSDEDIELDNDDFMSVYSSHTRTTFRTAPQPFDPDAGRDKLTKQVYA